jgi:hypothetical protein
LCAVACSSSPSNLGFSSGDGGNRDGASPGCTTCVADTDCNGGRCAQLAGDSYCATESGSGSSCSTSGDTCVGAMTSNGQAVQVCVPPGECGSSSSSGGSSGGGSGSGGSSGGSSGGADATAPYDAGGTQPVGTVGANGGSLTRLLFAVVGDTRPPNEDDVSGYPSSIITKIFQDVQAQASPAIPFVVSTGDYQFSSTGSSSTASQQLMLYQQARGAYSGVQYTAMGNHECTGGDSSNCGTGNTNGITANYTAFMTQLLGPIQKTLPYYVININATDSSWTSKFVFIAANAWDSTQQSWLQTAMGQTTTYTFVIRHEPTESSGGAPGVTPSDSIITQFPYTMLITGHSHTWDSFGYNTPKEVLVGNGGAPLSNTSKDYGFAVMSQRSDGAIVCDMLDYMTLQAATEFHTVVTPDGTVTK